MLDKNKTDKKLGLEIQAHLENLGLHTPIIKEVYKPIHDEEKEHIKIKKIEGLVGQIMNVLGLDLEDDSLSETPSRVAKMFVKENFWGLEPANFPKCTTVENKMHYDEMILEKCSVNSNCEHHFVYFGSLHNTDLGCWVAYIPRDEVLGLSKLSRIVEYFCARPQIQERLTEQISASLQYILKTNDVAVVVKAQHFCVLTRGVMDPNSYTITSKLSGRFLQDSTVRNEFMNLTR